MNPRTRAILERYDEPGSYEFHSEFDYPDMEARAQAVASELEAAGIKTRLEGAIYHQDASFSIAVLLVEYERKGDGLCQSAIRFSNFGNLAAVTGSGHVPDCVLKAIARELDAQGFTLLPADELDDAYDGVMQDKSLDTWWTRYFDWL